MANDAYDNAKTDREALAKNAEPKHTPGPWEVRELYDRDEVWMKGSLDPLAKICETDGIGGTNAADARLIAAAPELLFHLKAAEQLLAALQPILTAAEGIDLAPMRAAIARAEGGDDGE